MFDMPARCMGAKPLILLMCGYDFRQNVGTEIVI
jgi:hypothetical protein